LYIISYIFFTKNYNDSNYNMMELYH